MKNDAWAPTERSTAPLGNTSMKPSVLERGISENAARKLQDLSPDATRALREMIERKRRQMVTLANN